MNPNDEVVLDIRGIDELVEAVTEAPEITVPLAEQAMTRSLLAIGGRVWEYPPATEANRPRPWTSGGDNTWYERGHGSKWVRKDGTINGRKTSEFLGRQGNVETRRDSWSQEIDINADDLVIEGVMGTAASYADAVIGERQAAFHARRGWTTMRQGLERSEEDIDAAFGEAADKLIAALAED